MARAGAAAAWDETVAYYERVEAMEQDDLSAAEAELGAATERREAATASRATYTRRSVGGLTDARTGQVRRDADANAANRRRAAGAAQRVLDEAEYEAAAVADWLEADQRARSLEDKAALARRLRDGEADLREAESLVDSNLAAEAIQLTRERDRRCTP